MGDETTKFRHAGIDCKIVKTDMGHYCGYARRPESVEPVRWTSDYDSKHGELLDAEVDVWGGVTYGPDDEGWVGFDDAHSRPLVKHREFDTDKEAVKNETERLAEQIAELADDDPDREPGEGESWGDDGEIRPVPPGVENEPEQ